MRTREVNAGCNIGNAKAAGDERGSAIDHGIPERARIVVPGIFHAH
jgi:hypothetical protein